MKTKKKIDWLVKAIKRLSKETKIPVGKVFKTSKKDKKRKNTISIRDLDKE